jgi:DNA polymerase-3 subunit gamma/tau
MEPQLPRPADYRVLARAYRPTRLSALIGQEALVRTLKNAFASGRVAHAFLLSGIRGVGKTTTARIIARGLNCTGPDGQGGPTPEPCGVCPSCQSIEEDRALDVIEMDAASQTGKEDVLDLLEGLQFLPSFSRYKVYILDEVHMLSPKAWNALLKTVEEPPPHAKFIFATTEIRKVPVTVLSRCQKFELRRVEPEELAQHLAGICAKEGVAATDEALAMVARAAEGSVRDALSLLDQAIATADGPIDGELVQAMLGLGDRLQLLELFETLMRGDAKGVLERFAALYALGADPVAVAQDLLEISHWLSRLKVAPDATSSLGIAASATQRAEAMAKELSLPVLARAWQMLLRGIDEIRAAPDARGAAEMLLLRLACVSDLPSPAELARLLRPADGHAPSPSPLRPVPGSPPALRRPAGASPQPAATLPIAAPVPASLTEPADFPDFVARLREGGEAPLAAWLQESAHLIRFEPGRLELRLADGVPTDVAGRVGEAATRVTGRRWVVIVGSAAGEATLAEQAATAKRARLAELASDPALQEVLAAFPGAALVDIRPRSG